jgi:hypothetical protein
VRPRDRGRRPSYRTIKGILAAGTELDGTTEPVAPQAPAHLRGPQAFDTDTTDQTA